MTFLWPLFDQTHAQSTLSGPITALAVDGDRLLIGQGSTLIDAAITPNDLQITQQIDLKRHTVRDIGVAQKITLALSEDGLTSLDNQDQVVDFVQGGGQRMVVKNGRVYIAALEAGVRILKVDAAGKLTPLGVMKTAGVANDVIPESNGWLWVAEGDSGVRLYDATNIENAPVLVWLDQFAPATQVQINGPRLIIGHGGNLSILSTINIKSPELLSTLAINDQAHISDLLISGDRAYVGQIGPDQTDDVLALDTSNTQKIAVVAHFGQTGDGQRLALHGDDLFIGSEQHGLRRIRFGADNPALLATWPAATPTACLLSAPSDPEPANLAETSDDSVTLKWKAACSPVSYEVKINGASVGTVNDPSYTFSPEKAVTTWQVTAIDGAGNRVDGPTWTFEKAVVGWLATPAAAPQTKLLYTPPVVVLRSPQQVLIATCAAMIIGLLVIVGAGWGLGLLADRRMASKKAAEEDF